MFKIKIIKALNILLFIFFSSSLLFSQSYQLLGNIKFGESIGELGKISTYEEGYFYDLIPDDIEIDREKNIYLCDKYTKRILKFNQDLKLIYSEQISDKLLKATHNFANEFQTLKKAFYTIDLETDNMGNLYALVTMGEAYLNLIKYDKNGILISEFLLSEQMPTQRLIDFFISTTGKIFINTFPHNPQDMRHINDGIVFVYDLDGNFLGRTDYFIEDSKGNAYQRNLLNADYLQIDLYYSNASGKVEKTTEKILKTNLKIDKANKNGWHFLGVDRFDNIYFMHGRQDIIVRKFDFSSNTIEDVKIEDKDLKNFGVLYGNNFHNISISFDGDIFLCGIKNSSGEESLSDKLNIENVSVSIIKIKH